MKELLERYEEWVIKYSKLDSLCLEQEMDNEKLTKDRDHYKEMNKTLCSIIKEKDEEKNFLCAELDRYIDTYGDINIKFTGEDNDN